MEVKQPAPGPARSAVDEGLRSELARMGVVATSFAALQNWGKRNSVWPLQFGLACCAIEMMATAASRYDLARFGSEIFRPSPRQADLMIVSGTVTKKMAPQVVRLWNQMPEPKFCIAMGVCAIAGGPFKQGYNVLKGIDRFIPVDVHIPGCPPRPEALIHAVMTLQAKIEKTLPSEMQAKLAEYPVPNFGAHDLEPALNKELWQAPKFDRLLAITPVKAAAAAKDAAPAAKPAAATAAAATASAPAAAASAPAAAATAPASSASADKKAPS